MKISFITFLIFSTMMMSCSSDPCEEINNLDCPTQDVDGDGIANGIDNAPTDPCNPDMLALACGFGDTDGDGFINADDADPSDPCVPNMDIVQCSTGDLDGDGTVNGEDSDPSDPCVPDDNIIACPTGDFDNDGTPNQDDSDPSDPCVPNMDILQCPTGDIDGDGVLNGDDDFPFDPCRPNAPSFSENIIGTWIWDGLGGSGRIKINEDGTYQDLQNAIVSNGQVVSRMWSVSGGRLKFEVINAQGFSASVNLKWKDYDCDSITFDGEGFGDIDFDRA